MRRERDARGVVRQVLELLLLWPQGGRERGREGRGEEGGWGWLLEIEKQESDRETPEKQIQEDHREENMAASSAISL